MSDLTEKFGGLQTQLADQHTALMARLQAMLDKQDITNIKLQGLIDAQNGVGSAFVGMYNELVKIRNNTNRLENIEINAAITAGNASDINGKMDDNNDRLLQIIAALALVKADTGNIVDVKDALITFFGEDNFGASLLWLNQLRDGLYRFQSLFYAPLSDFFDQQTIYSVLLNLQAYTLQTSNSAQFMEQDLDTVLYNMGQQYQVLTEIRDCGCGGESGGDVCSDYQRVLESGSIPAAQGAVLTNVQFDATVTGNVQQFPHRYFAVWNDFVAGVSSVEDPEAGVYTYGSNFSIIPSGTVACCIYNNTENTVGYLYVGVLGSPGWNVTELAPGQQSQVPTAEGVFFTLAYNNVPSAGTFQLRAYNAIG